MQIVNTFEAMTHNKRASQPDKLAARVSTSHVERDAQRGQQSKWRPCSSTPLMPHATKSFKSVTAVGTLRLNTVSDCSLNDLEPFFDN
ncbi:MAG TPA: hypothetical protein VMO20_00285 [Candidatus Acidoferrum sp.]|nr:hypothetical protein [Candidatus Acidoferrum sp.]